MDKESGNMSSHNRDVLSSRETILDAAMQVIAEKKISGIRMREIAGRAGISTGTLHYHFPTKEKLLQSLLDEMDRIFNEERAIQFSEMDLDPPAKFSWFLDQEKQILKDRRELAEVFVDFWGHGLKAPEIKCQIQKMYERWRDDIRAALKEVMISDQNDISKLALVPFLMVSLMEGAALQYLIDDSTFDLETYFRAAHEMVLCFLINGNVIRHKGGENEGRVSYPSDVSDEDWPKIEPLILGKNSVGRPRNVDLRGVVNGILYVISSGCSWRMLPQNYPNWSTVYRYFNLWKRDGVWEKIADVLGVQ
jgi:TetR/AcrR family transcriptional regulator